MGAPPLAWKRKRERSGARVEAGLDAAWEGWELHSSHVGNPPTSGTGMCDVLMEASLLPQAHLQSRERDFMDTCALRW